MKIFILLCTCAFFCTNIQSQNAQIVFYTEEPTTVYLFEPLDNAYNYQYATDTLYLKPKLKIEYNLQVVDFVFITISTPKLGKFVIPMTSNDKLQLNFKENELSFSGDNAAGIIYLNNKFIKQGLASYAENISSIFDKLKRSNSYSQIYQQCLNIITKDIYNDIDKLLANHQVSDYFCEIIKNDLNYAFSFNIINKYRLSQEKFPQDSIDIESAITNIYSCYPINVPNILMYNYAPAYVSYYYERNTYKENIDFGIYSYFLTAPSHILLPCIGRALLIDIIYSVTSFNHEKAYAYLASHFPNSDYVRIFRPLFCSMQTNAPISKSDSAQYITSAISRLEQLSNLEQFKEKYILLDIWASWCMPCKLEFQYTSVIHDILKQHTNLCLLYISIDEERFNEYWKTTIDDLHLNGFHLRVNNKKLYQDIIEKVYPRRKIMIPRYVLLSPSGKIINYNLPRPSSQYKFKETINNILRQRG